jgi:hypothetical protein
LPQVALIVRCPKSPAHFALSRARHEGRFAIVTKRWLRDAMDAKCCRTGSAFADGEVAWSRYPDADIKLRGNIREAMVARKPGSPGRARRKPLKPFARGMPDCFGEPVVTNSCAFFVAREATGARERPGIPCALVPWASISKLRAHHAARRRTCVELARKIENEFGYHCEDKMRRSNPYL